MKKGSLISVTYLLILNFLNGLNCLWAPIAFPIFLTYCSLGGPLITTLILPSCCSIDYQYLVPITKWDSFRQNYASKVFCASTARKVTCLSILGSFNKFILFIMVIVLSLEALLSFLLNTASCASRMSCSLILLLTAIISPYLRCAFLFWFSVHWIIVFWARQ